MDLATIGPVAAMVAGALLLFGPGLLRFFKVKAPGSGLAPVVEPDEPVSVDDHHMALDLFSCLYQVRSVLHSQGYSEAVQVIDTQLVPSIMQAAQKAADSEAADEGDFDDE